MPPVSENILRRLELPVLRRLEGLLQGDYRSPSRGDGLDLADLREYQFHDDVRRMDWNATARLGTPYVRDYIEDREIPVWFLLDMSPSMMFEGVSISKHSVLMEFTTLMCRLMLSRGNRAGALIFSGKIDQTIPVRGGRRQLLQILAAVAAYRPGQGATDLKQVLKDAAAAIRRRSLVFIVSDFISPLDWERELTALAARHDVVAVRLTDLLETRLPDLGLLTFQDAESGEQLFVDTHDRQFLARFAAAADAREAALQGVFEKCGVDAVELATEDDVMDALARFAQLRKHSLRRSG
ncbi:MAG TPA: DUF58 domain-containing protein [Rhizomicrobium sp.]|nr:DUF58 domain-containing protein [Rhizomicrobium sp.]